MIIRSFKGDEELETVYNLPKTHQFLTRQFDFLTISDEKKKCIALLDFKTPQMCEWFVDKNPVKSDLKIVNALVLGTDESSSYHALFDIVEAKYNLFRIKSLGFVNILNAYRNVGTPVDKFRIELSSFHDKHRIGGILTVPIDKSISSRSYDFVSSITSNKLTNSVVKEKLATWIKETQKMHNFINTKSTKILEFDDFIQLLADEYHISISHVFHKSYFQQFRSFVSNMNIDRFSELFETASTDRYDRIWKDLDSIGRHSPTYNFKGIRIQPVVGNINVTFLGSSLRISSSRQMEFKIILTALDMLDQLDTLENHIERTKLINA